VAEEYGREYAETRGIDFTMRDLVEIARTHDAGVRTMLAAGLTPLILDTDPLMTAVWADMLFGKRDPWFDKWDATADLYLLFDIDLPWVADGTRMFGTPELGRWSPATVRRGGRACCARWKRPARAGG